MDQETQSPAPHDGDTQPGERGEDVPLGELEVILFDCQTTGASPARGQLIDVAWCVTSANALGAGAPEIHGSLVALEPGARLSKRVREMTGISASMLKGAPGLNEVAAQLAQTLDKARADGALVPVAHYAQFERPFIADLLVRAGREGALDDDVCTHKIAQRLMPGLPRRGLRAIAGYFGEMLSDEKRAHTHVAATAIIWREVVELLTQEEEVTTLGELRGWIATKKVDRGAEREFPLAREARLGLPRAPGVYRMLNKRGDVLYVGKATNLKQRVNSYFRGKKGGGERKLEMATQVWEVDVTQVSSPLEAAMCEVDAIKRHDPPYNKQLRRKNRAVWFTHPERLDRISRAPDAEHPLGPFAPKSAIEEVRDLIGALSAGRPNVELFWGLEDETIYEQGAALLAQRRPELFATHFVTWERCGEQLWAEYLVYLEEKAAREAEEAARADQALEEVALQEEEEEQARARKLTWTPFLVAVTMERVIRRAARRARRGHMLAKLVDASICWRAPHAQGEPRLMITTRAGHVQGPPTRVEDGAEIPWPPAQARDPMARLVLLSDIDTFDRLKVLLGELRRVLRDSPEVWARFGEGAVWDREALLEAMRMF